MIGERDKMLENKKSLLWQTYSKMKDKDFLKLNHGSVSVYDREEDKMIITSSAHKATEADICIVDAEGNIIEGTQPAVDYETHLGIYRTFPELTTIAFKQSGYTMVWAAMKERIRPFTTFHAEHFRGEVLCTPVIPEESTDKDYYGEIAHLIQATMQHRSTNDMPGILVAQHGAYIWGQSLEEMYDTTVALEEIADTAWHTVSVAGGLQGPQISYKMVEKNFKENHK